MSLFFGKRSRPKDLLGRFSLGIGCSYCRILLLVDISCRNVDIIIAMFDIISFTIAILNKKKINLFKSYAFGTLPLLDV